jgi:uncharacterized membrane protein
MDLATILNDVTLQKPSMLLWTIPVLVIVLYIINKSFIEVREDALATLRRRRARRVMVVTRIMIITLIMLAFATPIKVEERAVQTEPFIKLLIDNSSSMGIYDNSVIENLEKELSGKLTVKAASIAEADRSDLGEGILARVKKGDNVLLVTDGQSTSGPSLGDVAMFAAANNITLSAVRMPIAKSDAWVTLDGPTKVASNVESTFTVTVGTTGAAASVKLKVTIDGESAIDATVPAGTQSFKKTLAEGTHRIVATIDAQDAFGQNNVFHKTVKAVAKPKVLYWSEKNDPPMQQLYSQVYDVTRTGDLPSDISNYYAIVVDDIPGSGMSNSQVQTLNEFVTDGGGLLVIGGPNSYDRGGYQTSQIKNLLPVIIGSPGKDIGDTNIVILIDASQSASGEEGAGITISRKLTLGIIEDMDPKTRLGVVAFRQSAEVVSELARKDQTADLIDRVKRIYGAGSSNMAEGIQVSLEMLSKSQGSKNLVIISDGLLLSQIAAQSRTMVQQALDQGVKVYTIGAAIGDEAFIQDRVEEDMLKELATISHGIYFRANEASRLKLIFNPAKDEKQKTDNDRQATVLDSNHFITEGFNFKDAMLTGYNAMIPKSSARLLATLASGEPLLAVWRLGLGRVASLGTDDGTGWAGPLVNKDNSAFALRTLNWAIGDPDRKDKYRVEIADGHMGEPLEIQVTADTPPTSKDMTLVRTGENTYKGTIMPEQTGFVTILGTTAAVNGPMEFRQIGESKALDRAVGTTDGRWFAPTASEQIAEFARTKSLQVVREEIPLRWPIAIAIFCVWIIELVIRRLLGKS